MEPPSVAAASRIRHLFDTRYVAPRARRRFLGVVGVLLRHDVIHHHVGEKKRVRNLRSGSGRAAGCRTDPQCGFGDFCTSDTQAFPVERGSVVPFLHEVDGTRIRRHHSGGRRLVEYRDSAFGDCRISGRRVVLVVAARTAEVARLVPVLTAQILRSSLPSRFCVVRFGAF